MIFNCRLTDLNANWSNFYCNISLDLPDIFRVYIIEISFMDYFTPLFFLTSCCDNKIVLVWNLWMVIIHGIICMQRGWTKGPPDNPRRPWPSVNVSTHQYGDGSSRSHVGRRRIRHMEGIVLGDFHGFPIIWEIRRIFSVCKFETHLSPLSIFSILPHFGSHS